MARTGRPTKRTPELLDRIIECAEKGYPNRTIAVTVGIDQDTLQEWLKEAEFSERFHDAKEKRLQLCLNTVYSAVNDPKYATWLLARLIPEQYALRQRVDIANANGKPFQTANIDMANMSTADIMNYMARLEAALTEDSDPAEEAE